MRIKLWHVFLFFIVLMSVEPSFRASSLSYDFLTSKPFFEEKKLDTKPVIASTNELPTKSDDKSITLQTDDDNDDDEEEDDDNEEASQAKNNFSNTGIYYSRYNPTHLFPIGIKNGFTQIPLFILYCSLKIPFPYFNFL